MVRLTDRPDRTLDLYLGRKTTIQQYNNHAIFVGSCTPMTIPMCQSLDYNTTQMPNIFGQNSVEEAGLEAHQFYPLIQVNG